MSISRLLSRLLIAILANVSFGEESLNTEDPGFIIFRDNCMACHLSTGMGIKAMNAPSIAGLPRWYVSSELRLFRSDKRGFHTDDPAGNLMQVTASQLSERDIAFIGRYIQSLAPNSKRAALNLEVKPDSKQLYLMHCGNCHGEDAQGSRKSRVPPLTHQQDWYLLRQIENFQSAKRTHDDAFSYPEITADESNAIVAWLSKLGIE